MPEDQSNNEKKQTAESFNEVSGASLVPTVFDKDRNGERGYDVFSRLLRDRVIYLHDGVNTVSASLVSAQLQFLDTNEPGKEIQLVINSPGGSVTDGLAILDTMRSIKSPVATIGMGMSASMGSFLLAAGTKGKRAMLPNATNMVHQIAGGSQGKARDMAGRLDFSMRLNNRLHLMYKQFCGFNDEEYKMLHQMAKDDTFVNPLIAQKLGLIDHIIKPAGYGKDQNVTEEFDMLMDLYQHELDSIPDADPKNIFDYDPNLQNYRIVKQIIASREARGANGPAASNDNPKTPDNNKNSGPANVANGPA